MSLLDKFLSSPKNRVAETAKYSDKIALFNNKQNSTAKNKVSTANIDKAAKASVKK